MPSVTEECTEILFDFAKTESERLVDIIKQSGGLYGRQKEAIEKYFEYSQISLSDF